MKVSTNSAIHGTRPVNTLWNRLLLDPVSARLGLVIANHTNLKPLLLTICSFLLSLVSALLFLMAVPISLVVGAVIFQLSTLADNLDGMVARIKPGSGSILALVADHALDPWRVILNVLALAYGQYKLAGQEAILIWAAIFLCMHFMDWTLPKTIAKVRGAYRGLYEPGFTGVDGFCMKLKSFFSRFRLKVIFFGTHEREVTVLLVGPIFGCVEETLIIGTTLTVMFYLLRLRFDTALVKKELLFGTQEYLGDSENPWEMGAKSINRDGQDEHDK